MDVTDNVDGALDPRIQVIIFIKIIFPFVLLMLINIYFFKVIGYMRK